MNTDPAPAPTFVQLLPGDPAPWFTQDSTSTPAYSFDTAAGRYIVLCFYGTAGDQSGHAALDAVLSNRSWFDDERASFFGVSVDPADQRLGRVETSLPGIRHFWDFDASVSRLFGAAPREGARDGEIAMRRLWIVLDPTLRVLKVFPLGEHSALFAYLRGLPPPARFAGFELQAPVLVLPNVFEPELCRALVDSFEANGGKASGVMREIDGKTVGVHDAGFKIRRDYVLTDQHFIEMTRARVARRIVPEIRKAHQFNVTRMERYLVCCYAAAEGGHFSAHRDDITPATAHRRFAVSINLNTEFEGGEVSFPEYGPRGFKPPPGGALVFSCSLLHAVAPVTAGRRYVFLPFLYDDAAAKIREANANSIAAGGGDRA